MAEVEEYKRTCLECRKVWHSLVSRENQLGHNQKANCCESVANATNPAAAAQAKRNLEANQSEIARLHQCPQCQSTHYDEIVVTHEKRQIHR